MLNSLGLGFVFTAKDLASGTMRRVEGRFSKLDATSAAASKSFKRNVGTMVAGLGLMTAGALGLGAAFNLAGKYGSFEKGLAKVGAITRATDADLARLKQRALQAGIDTQFSPDEAVAGLGELGVRGFNATQSMRALGGALDLAAGGEIAVAQAASTTAAALRVFEKDASFAGEAADKLLKISNITALRAGDLEVALGSVARGAISGKQGIDEMLVSIGLVRNAGNEASASANSISAGIQAIAKNRDKFRAIGVAVDDAAGNMKNYLDIVLETDAALSASGKTGTKRVAEELELFGRFGQLGFTASIAQINKGMETVDGRFVRGADALRYLRTEMEQAAGTAAKFRDQLLDTFEGQKTLLSGSMQTLGITMGEAFAVALKPVVSTIIRVVNVMIKGINAIPAPMKRMLGGAFVLISSLVTLAGALMAGVAAFGLIKMAVVAFAGPLLVLGKILAVAVGAGMLLAGMFAVLRNAFDSNLGGFGDKLRGVADKVSLFFNALRQLTSGDGRLRGNVLKDLVDPANQSILSLAQRFQQVRHRVMSFFTGIRVAFQSVMETAGPTFKALGGAVEEFATALGFGGKAFGMLTSTGKDWHFAGSTIGEIVGDLTRLFLNGLVVAIRVATGVVKALKTAYSILETPMLVVFWLGVGMAAMFGVMLRVFTDVSEATNSTGSNMARLSELIGFGIGVWVTLRGAIMLGRGALIAYRVTAVAFVAVQKAIAVASAMMHSAILGPVVAVGALAYLLASAADEYWGISDAMADYFVSLTKEGQAVEKLNEAYRTTLKVRGQIAAFDSLQAAAESQGKNVLDYAEEKASTIAGETRAQQLGLSKAEIKRRLLEGEELYQKADFAKVNPETGGTEAIVSVKNGQADKAKAAADTQADAFEAALARNEKAGKPVKFQANLVIDKQQIAKVVKEAQASADAMDFEADFGMGS